MKDAPGEMSREERLAAKLRENLRRRKAQARAMTAPGASETEFRDEFESHRVSKSSPDS